MDRTIIFLTLFATAFSLPLRESSFDLKESRATGNVKFYLYTASNPSEPQHLFIGDEESVRNSHFEKNRQTKIIIHGWHNSYETTPNGEIREAYLSKDNYNIICIDWSEYAKLNYLSARAKVPIVGEDIAEFLDFLNEKLDLDFDKLVVIGHSLGAHVAGFTGKRVKRGKVAAIVGLDPAFPLYSYADSATRLYSDDAKYVQTVQTNGNVNGFFKPIGSSSFYPNWGKLQPGCGIDFDGNCSHARSVSYYAEAIRGYSFDPVYKCSSFEDISAKSEVGCGNVDSGAKIGDPLEVQRVYGIFYLKTNEQAPFGHF